MQSELRTLNLALDIKSRQFAKEAQRRFEEIEEVQFDLELKKHRDGRIQNPGHSKQKILSLWEGVGRAKGLQLYAIIYKG